MLLENVSALLGMNKECRKVLNYILQVRNLEQLLIVCLDLLCNIPARQPERGAWPSFGLRISLLMLDFRWGTQG